MRNDYKCMIYIQKWAQCIIIITYEKWPFWIFKITLDIYINDDVVIHIYKIILLYKNLCNYKFWPMLCCEQISNISDVCILIFVQTYPTYLSNKWNDMTRYVMNMSNLKWFHLWKKICNKCKNIIHMWHMICWGGNHAG